MWQFNSHKNKFVITHKRQGIFASCGRARLRKFFPYSHDQSHSKTAVIAREWLIKETRSRNLLHNGYKLITPEMLLAVKVENCRGDKFISILAVEYLDMFRGSFWKLSITKNKEQSRKRLYRWYPNTKEPRFIIPLFTIKDSETKDQMQKCCQFMKERRCKRDVFTAYRKWKRISVRFNKMQNTFDKWSAMEKGYCFI